MAYKSYVPIKDADFIKWAEKLMEISAENYETWSIAPHEDVIGTTVAVFKQKLARMNDPNHGKIDTFEKNEARKAAEKACRTYVQGYIARNPKVTDTMRGYMGLTVYDTIPTSVADPIGLVTATIKYPNAGALELHIKHVEGTPMDIKANYGFRIYYGVYAADDSMPETGEDLRASKFTRQKKMLFTFNPKDSGKTACFCIRYENSKGKAGQWGSLISAIIP